MCKTHFLLDQLLNLELFFYEFNLLYRYKTCAIFVSNTGKQQPFANKRIYRFSDKDRSVPDDIDL